MNYVFDILKGILIGIANIVPGVSGGTLAVSMGIYDKIIHSVTHFHKEPKKSIVTLLPYGIGALIAVGGLSFLIESLFLYYQLQTSLTFVGLILGGLPTIWGKVATKKTTVSGGICFAVMFLFILSTAIASGASSVVADLSPTPLHILQLFAVGMVAAATMVIPGVSGSMLLMMLGYYQPILSTINRFMVALATTSLTDALAECMILIPFGLGVVIGIFLCAKLIELLLTHFEQNTYYAIMGLVISSPIVILMGISPASITVSAVVVGMVCFVLSLLLAIRLSH